MFMDGSSRVDPMGGPVPGLLLLLLLQVRDALVLVGLVVRLLFPLPARAPAYRVRGAADRGRAQQWAPSSDHDLPPSS